jgi:hypothetical protein
MVIQANETYKFKHKAAQYFFQPQAAGYGERWRKCLGQGPLHDEQWPKIFLYPRQQARAVSKPIDRKNHECDQEQDVEVTRAPPLKHLHPHPMTRIQSVKLE